MMMFRATAVGLWVLVIIHVVMLSVFWSQERDQHIRYVLHDATYTIIDGHRQPNPRTGSYENYSDSVYAVHFLWIVTWISTSFLARFFDREQARGALRHCCDYWIGVWTLQFLCAVIAWSITIAILVYDRDTIGWFQTSAPLALMIEVIFAIITVTAGLVVTTSVAYYFFHGCFVSKTDDKPPSALDFV